MPSTIRLLLLVSLIAVAVNLSACSRPSMTLGEGSPPTFNLSGNYAVQNFQVSQKGGETIWLVYVRENRATLSGIGSIKYGVVPSGCCYQDIPVGTAPPLKEGMTYIAAADIFDASSLWIEFTIKNGKAVVTHTSAERGH